MHYECGYLTSLSQTMYEATDSNERACHVFADLLPNHKLGTDIYMITITFQ